MKGDKTMKKLISITLIMMLTIAFLTIGSTRADAMDNESAALLTAGIVLLSLPVIYAIANSGPYHEPAYYHAGPPRYIERTRVIHAQPRYEKYRGHGNWAQPYKEGYRQEWNQQDHRGVSRDAHRDYRRGR
jgi:hypothetical protein